MKTIGLIGGMSWESTVPYYRHINTRVKQRLGGLHSARLLLYSVDFQDIETLQQAGRWEDAADLLSEVARMLERAGADCVVLCTNTMHKVAPEIEAAVAVPLLHIADATATAIRKQGIRRVGLLGTRFTMEEDFYRARIEAHGIETLVPETADREMIHAVIYEELCLGVVENTSHQRYREAIDRLVERGAEGIILGCTEIAMLVSPSDATVPLFDTATLHAEAAADFALEDA
ncbi:aspartate/glutamate racemase family protein [Acidihalobacter prosperus]|uniref:Aspartate racemase n=1 Tax=Acidihalobacter prosperus TaxID=160660 RepID=A0A1A6C5B6_9GAMM|nr:aspartate/glutamate racemase family protein [Acidihalobacter prosperus]OBS09753.1 hypothetical protein Thpro_020803 [Acidihalobacter prosperus]